MSHWFLKCSKCKETMHLGRQVKKCPNCGSTEIKCNVNKGYYEMLDKAAEHFAEKEARYSKGVDKAK